MARCLAREPRVLVLCEPTAGVDVGTRQAIYEFIAEPGPGRAVAGGVLVGHRRPARHLHPGARHVQRAACRELAGSDITEQALLHAMEETEQV